MSSKNTAHRSDPMFIRKFISHFQNNELHVLKGEKSNDAFKQFNQDMKDDGEYEVVFVFFVI